MGQYWFSPWIPHMGPWEVGPGPDSPHHGYIPRSSGGANMEAHRDVEIVRPYFLQVPGTSWGVPLAPTLHPPGGARYLDRYPLTSLPKIKMMVAFYSKKKSKIVPIRCRYITTDIKKCQKSDLWLGTLGVKLGEKERGVPEVPAMGTLGTPREVSGVFSDHQDPYWRVLVEGGMRVSGCGTNVCNEPTCSRPIGMWFFRTIGKKDAQFVELTTKLELTELTKILQSQSCGFHQRWAATLCCTKQSTNASVATLKTVRQTCSVSVLIVPLRYATALLAAKTTKKCCSVANISGVVVKFHCATLNTNGNSAVLRYTNRYEGGQTRKDTVHSGPRPGCTRGFPVETPKVWGFSASNWMPHLPRPIPNPEPVRGLTGFFRIFGVRVGTLVSHTRYISYGNISQS
ncbi:uncharacterized protein PGTG_04167 [Puccinia graminis f. sp. tritici CRL 75-36-700-3]|uniref:Uncharacterized protein n=1 Tax=Puccinia graminis f. sp. tritici (strain CRL 75-36-700-3 / race SCCL) TaxID=418459 RepID=E3K1N6_PUCGT|nr:uncharacterized protein PGTG_04167 [Puccinia graminis f. sp. tritici CRL 75-36-700-3]EFP78211.1 hypothetical protein PGTG_04167 [Puccinia graminis f. sp. tritici CRL 75-36-700-3]